MPILKIMSWNIEDFDINKIFDNFAYNVDNAPLSQYRFEHIFNNMAPPGLNNLADLYPSIIIIQEFIGKEDHNLKRGSLSDNESSMINLMLVVKDQLNYRIPNSAWSVVPPVKLSNQGIDGRHRIAVFFDNTKLDFIGPNIWRRDTPIDPANSLNDIGYTGNFTPFAQFLPNIPIPQNVTIPSATSQNQLAGRLINKKSGRSPWLVSFREKYDIEVNPTPRRINIYACHLPRAFFNLNKYNRPVEITSNSDLQKARQAYFDSLASYFNDPAFPARKNAGSLSVDVIVGDFNVDITENLQFNETYIQSFTGNLRFEILFNEANLGTTNGSFLDRNPSIYLHNKAINFIGSNADNALIRFGSKANKPTKLKNLNPRILDRVTGIDSTATTRGIGYGIDMDLKIEQMFERLELAMTQDNLDHLNQEAKDKNIKDKRLLFIQKIFDKPENYGHIRGKNADQTLSGVSDHMALIFDV